MFGKVYFIDNHIEDILSYQFNSTNSELYFTTETGNYGYKQYVIPSEYELEYSFKGEFYFPHDQFYKYNKDYGKWLVIIDIDHIEIYTEVFHD